MQVSDVLLLFRNPTPFSNTFIDIANLPEVVGPALPANRRYLIDRIDAVNRSAVTRAFLRLATDAGLDLLGGLPIGGPPTEGTISVSRRFESPIQVPAGASVLATFVSGTLGVMDVTIGGWIVDSN
jgi:hypothetical protein